MILTGKLHKILLLLFFFYSFVAFPQSSILDKKINLQCTNQSLVSVLKLIEKRENINFVYVSGLFNPNKIVSISVKNSSIRAISQQLIQDKNIEFFATGRNIVLSKKDKSHVEKKTLNPTVIASDKVSSVNFSKENIVVHDTLSVVIRDTLTIIKHDTILKPVPQHIQEKKTPIVGTKIKKNSSRRLSIGAYVKYDFPNEEFLKGTSSNLVFNRVKAAEKIKSSFKGGVSLEYRGNTFGIQSGLGVSTRSWSTSYNYTTTSTDSSKLTGYNETSSWDITEILPHIPGEIVKYDSIEVITKTPVYKKDTIKENYSNINKASYLTIPLQLNYYYQFSKRLEIQLGVGAELMLLYNSQGKILVLDNAYLDNIDNYLKDYYLRMNAMVGINYSLTTSQSIGLQTSFGFNVTPVFRATYPIQRSENAITIALCYDWNFFIP